MMPPKMVPRALVSLGIMMTRMAGCSGPGRAAAFGSVNARSLSRGSAAGVERSCYPRRLRRARASQEAYATGMDETSSQPGSLAALNDVTLVRQIADRQPEALSELYDRYAATL